jgi:uncharacterized protein
MQYFVYGVDDEGVEERLEALGEAHWAYMDRHAQRLVARGPTLSGDGSHTGSVHVIEAGSLHDARRFAFEEPYWLAGLYASVMVTRFESALGRTMWDRPQASAGEPSTLVLVTWDAEPGTATVPGCDDKLSTIGRLERLVFGGLLVDEAAAQCVGLVAALDVDMMAAGELIAALPMPQTSMVKTRWCRGGRGES